jgi:DNA helicase HerA-like ATPase
LAARKYGNRHGLVAGATGTGKSVSLMVLARRLFAHGRAGGDGGRQGRYRRTRSGRHMNERIAQRVAEIGIEGYAPRAIRWFLGPLRQARPPAADHDFRTRPTLLQRILELNDVQSGVLDIAFKLADDKGLLLLDLGDLRALLNFVLENRAKSQGLRPGQPAVGGGDPARAAAPGQDGGETFFGEPALQLADLMRQDGSAAASSTCWRPTS